MTKRQGPCGDCKEEVDVVHDTGDQPVQFGCMAFFHFNKEVILHDVDYRPYCKAYTPKEVAP